MRLNELNDKEGARHARKRVGRGIGSGLGKTSGKGQKGQKSRSGVSLLGFEGGQMPIYRRLPKRGFKNPFRKEYTALNLGQLQTAVDEKRLDASKPVTSEILVAVGVAKRGTDGVKVLGQGELTAKLELQVEAASKTAIAAVEKAGGSVTLPTPKAKPEKAKGRRRDRISAERQARYAKFGQGDGDNG